MAIKRSPTSVDVASIAQVSQSTVSRALRGDPSVAAATRERISRIAKQVGYHPDSRAVRLREKQVGMIAVVVLFPEGNSRQLLNPFYYDVVSAVEAAAGRRGIGVLLSCQSDAGSLRSDFEKRREADGIIVIGTTANRSGWEFFTQASREGANVVAWGSPDDALPTVRADNLLAGRLAADHLIRSGRRRLCFAGPDWENHAAFRLRRLGFINELAERGVTHSSLHFDLSDTERAKQGEAWVNAALTHSPELDGIFAAADSLAAGIMRGLLRAGRRIPQEVAVIGFDGGYGALQVTPTLTTIETDIAEAGEHLVSASLAQQGSEAGRRLPSVPVRLAVRESSP